MKAQPNPPPRTLGLALSGGGSRAAAFHCGTLKALMDLNLVERIDTVSTVSGGSVFGGAWMASRTRRQSDADFLQNMHDELKGGFVLRSVRPRLIKTVVPFLRYSRTSVIAETFNKIFFQNMTLGQLPVRPALCINTTVVNNGQVGKFSRLGFSAPGLYLAGAKPSNQIPSTNFPLAKAVAASAAFPVGLPPLQLRKSDLDEKVEFRQSLEGASRLALTDGGVLENLGIQTLLKSGRFGTWDMVVSDAGTASTLWKYGALLNPVRSFGLWALSGSTLDQMMMIMNDKQNRWAREQVFGEMERTWLADALRTGTASSGMPLFLRTGPSLSRRSALFVRVNQTWRRLLEAIPPYRLQELSGSAQAAALPTDAVSIEQFLRTAGVNLKAAQDCYASLGGDAGAAAMNSVTTNFTALSEDVLKKLALHAAWQVHLTHAIYGL
jgi:NTE family protein